MDDVHDGGEVERGCQLRRHAHGVEQRGRAVFPHREIEGLGLNVLSREVRRHTDETRANGRRKRRMLELGRDQPFECLDQLVHALGRQVETEQLDRNQPFTFSVISAEYRAERPCANLMKNSKGSERVGNRGAASFRVQ
jgi:hypothetical protein